MLLDFYERILNDGRISHALLSDLLDLLEYTPVEVIRYCRELLRHLRYGMYYYEKVCACLCLSLASAGLLITPALDLRMSGVLEYVRYVALRAYYKSNRQISGLEALDAIGKVLLLQTTAVEPKP